VSAEAVAAGAGTFGGGAAAAGKAYVANEER
jgi:hypothetical protein